MALTCCSTWENQLCTLPGQYIRTDSDGRDAGEPALKIYKHGRACLASCQPCGSVPHLQPLPPRTSGKPDTGVIVRGSPAYTLKA